METRLQAGVWYDPNNVTKELKIPSWKQPRQFDILIKVVQIASRHSGLCFGGFVRDVLVPYMNNPSLDKAVFSDVDLWFTEQKDADAFISDTKFILSLINEEYSLTFELNSSPHPGGKIYPFGREQYHLYLGKQFISFIDVVVSSTIPVDDFDINRLTIRIEEGKLISKFFGQSLNILDDTERKRTTMLDSYIKRLLKDDVNQSIFLRRVNENYLAKGWIITCMKQHVLPAKIDIFWLRSVFIPTAKLYFEELERTNNITSSVNTKEDRFGVIHDCRGNHVCYPK